MILEHFSDIFQLKEYTEVEFIAKVTNVTCPTDTPDRLIVWFFDGYENNRFTVYTDNNAIREILYNNTVYRMWGVARGLKRRYFMLKGFEPIDVTLDIETKYYPERFKHITDMMKLTYDTSIAKIKDLKLRQFVGYCLGIVTTGYAPSDKQKAKYNIFATAPASLSHHDAYSGGYVAHIAGMLAIVDKLEEIYGSGFRTEDISKIDWDLLRAIVYLHDIGKPLTYQKDYSGQYSWNENILEDHAYLGAQHVYYCWKKTNILPEAVVQKLLYCISEHMNMQKQFDDKKVPELRLLRAIDSLDTAIVSMLM